MESIKYYDIGLNLFCRQFREPEIIIKDAQSNGIRCILTGTDMKENQIRCLEKHIVLAEKLGKPLFLHERSAAGDFIKRFKKHPDICHKSVVHCFTGNKQTLEQYLSMGFSIGITGWICDDRRGKELREAVHIIPLDRILVETDAPYLTPKNVPGLDRTNVPQNIKYVVRDLAKYMKVSEDILIEHAKKNTERIFQIEV